MRGNISRLQVGIAVFILLVAAFARLYMLGEAPPGLQHDEIFKAQEGRALIEQGDFRVFYPTNQGHEGAYVWVLGLSYLLFGASFMMVKFPPLVFGLLTVALMYRVTGEIFNRRAGFIASALTAFSFWGIFTSRVGLRAVMLPVVVLCFIWGINRLYRQAKTDDGGVPVFSKITLLIAFILGIALYTYTSSFALHTGFVAFMAALILFDRPMFRRLWKPLTVIAVITIVMALPMIAIRLNEPEGQDRISTITRPLNDFLDGKPTELIENAVKLAGMPFFTGDPEWRYNIAGRPLFATPVGLLVYVGLAVAVWRIRKQPIMVLFIATALVGLVPSLLTVSAPSFLRSIVALPSIMIFIALAIDALPNKRWGWNIGFVAVMLTAVTDWPAYFDQWPRNEEVQSIYRDDLEQLALHVPTQPDALALVSTTNVDLDPTLFGYYQPPANAEVVFFDGRTTLVLPAHDAQRETTLYISPWSQITPPHADWLTETNGTQSLSPLLRQDDVTTFERYQLESSGQTLQTQLSEVRYPVFSYENLPYPRGTVESWASRLDYPINFNNMVELVGLELPRTQIATEFDGVNIQLYLHPLVDNIDLPLNVFVHMQGRDGSVHAQRDLMGVPTVQWTPDILFIQDNFVIAGPTQPGFYIITMGVYNFHTGEKLPIVDENGTAIADQIIVGRVRVVEK